MGSEEVRREAKEYFGDVDPSHDWLHVERVERLAQKIAVQEGADEEIVRLAVLLHDIGREKEDDGEIEDHAEWGAREAEKILENLGYEHETVEHVSDCIRSHRFSTGPEPESLEAKVLSDADNIDAVGAVGIARTFSVGGERGNPIADPGLPVEKDETESGETSLNHFYKKILELEERMYTDTGRQIIEDRHDFTRRFVERMEREIRGEK